MAVVYVSEYSSMALHNGQLIMAGKEPALDTQTVAIGGGSTASSAFNAKTKFIRVHTDAICSIHIATAATATTSTPRMAANATEFFGVNGGDQIAVITNT